MTTYDVTSDDEPIDVRAVSEDDQRVEQLRHALSPDAAVIWDDDDDELEPAFALLRALQLDVSADLPAAEPILPAGVTRLVPRRRLSRTATIAAVAAGVLSIGGVAAASAPGQPLAGVRHAVSDAVSHAVAAITPDSPVGPTMDATKKPSAKPTPPGEAVSTAARSASAISQVDKNLTRAAAFLDAGKAAQAKQQLVAAARKLALVTDPVAKARLQARLTALQARLAAMPTAKPTHGPSDDKGKGHDGNGDDGTGDESNRGKDSDTSGKGTDDGDTSGKSRPDVTRTPKATPTRDKSSDTSGRDDVKTPDEPSSDLTSDGDSDNSGHGSN